MAGIPYPEPAVVKTLSQISEDLYQLETELLRGNVAWRDCWADVRQIRQDLEPHIVAPAHDTPGEGLVLPGGSVWCVDMVISYEGHSTVRCFVREEDARHLAAAIEAYPEPPDYPSAVSGDDAWARFSTAEQAWRNNHPAGEDYTYGDYYIVRELKLSTPAALTGDQPPA